MTDPQTQSSPEPGSFASDAAIARLRRRHAAEQRFKAYGMIAIAIAISSLFILVFAIVSQALSAFSSHQVRFDLQLAAETIVPGGDREDSEAIASNVSGFNSLVQANLRKRFPGASEDRIARRELYQIVPRLAVLPLARKTARDPGLIGTEHSVYLTLSDDVDLYLKGGLTQRRTQAAGLPGRLGRNEAGNYTLSDASSDAFPQLREIWDIAEGESRPGVLIRLGEAWFRLEELSGASALMTYLVGPLPAPGEQAGNRFEAMVLSQPEANRTISDRQIAITTMLQEAGQIERRWNMRLLTGADSTYPEIAGAAAAIVGSLLTMLITAFFAIPVGILAAVYLEEFAPKNRLTDVIEVNINNLAAVPSIVFGLLGAAVFLNVFGMPRSVPFVGGLVLGLLVLPTVIIASRAALKSVPPSIRTAALGLGASKTQAVFHHVLPLAAPGIMTGSIIGMARALGETAPLLLIGMVAFVAEIPSGPGEESTVLPVLIYKWSTGAERAWEPMTSAVIVILLIFLVLMNLAAVLLRRRFERRW